MEAKKEWLEQMLAGMPTVYQTRLYRINTLFQF